MPRTAASSRLLRASMRRLRTVPSAVVKKVLAMMQLEVKYSGLERWMVKGVKSSWASSDSTVLYDMKFWQLAVYVFLAYIATSVFFTALLYPAYLANPASFSGRLPPNFSAVVAIFCMSLGALAQTAISISELVPASYYTISVVTIAHFYGIVMGAAVLGVLINRATIPQARVVFSDNCLFTSRDGEPVLILRIGNTRGNFLLNPEIRIGLLTVQSTMEGENIMRMSRLEIDEPPAMAPSVNITCRITPDSPLWGKTYWDLESEGAGVYVAIAATDNQHFQEVFVRKFYVAADMRFNCRFADTMKTTRDGVRVADFRRFNQIIENTFMPVSWGLTPDETAVVNGPDVIRHHVHRARAAATATTVSGTSSPTSSMSGHKGFANAALTSQSSLRERPRAQASETSFHTSAGNSEVESDFQRLLSRRQMLSEHHGSGGDGSAFDAYAAQSRGQLGPDRHMDIEPSPSDEGNATPESHKLRDAGEAGNTSGRSVGPSVSQQGWEGAREHEEHVAVATAETLRQLDGSDDGSDDGSATPRSAGAGASGTGTGLSLRDVVAAHGRPSAFEDTAASGSQVSQNASGSQVSQNAPSQLSAFAAAARERWRLDGDGSDDDTSSHASSRLSTRVSRKATSMGGQDPARVERFVASSAAEREAAGVLVSAAAAAAAAAPPRRLSGEVFDVDEALRTGETDKERMIHLAEQMVQLGVADVYEEEDERVASGTTAEDNTLIADAVRKQLRSARATLGQVVGVAAATMREIGHTVQAGGDAIFGDGDGAGAGEQEVSAREPSAALDATQAPRAAGEADAGPDAAQEPDAGLDVDKETGAALDPGEELGSPQETSAALGSDAALGAAKQPSGALEAGAALGSGHGSSAPLDTAESASVRHFAVGGGGSDASASSKHSSALVNALPAELPSARWFQGLSTASNEITSDLRARSIGAASLPGVAPGGKWFMGLSEASNEEPVATVATGHELVSELRSAAEAEAVRQRACSPTVVAAAVVIPGDRGAAAGRQAEIDSARVSAAGDGAVRAGPTGSGARAAAHGAAEAAAQRRAVPSGSPRGKVPAHNAAHDVSGGAAAATELNVKASGSEAVRAAGKPHVPLSPRAGKPGTVATGSLRGTMRAVVAAKRWRSMVAPVPEEGPLISESQPVKHDTTDESSDDDSDDDGDDSVPVDKAKSDPAKSAKVQARGNKLRAMLFSGGAPDSRYLQSLHSRRSNDSTSSSLSDVRTGPKDKNA